MMKYNLALLFVLFGLSVYPATSISRWFTSSYHDLRFTMRRFGHCVGDLPPLKDHSLNETDYLIQQMRLFLDQANYDNEQLSNVTGLMDSICRHDLDTSYPISVHIDVAKYTNNGTGKENRCRAIDEAMDAMFGVFKRAALNKSEPLDFSVIQFYPNPANKAVYYNLTDLINTSWIKSEFILEHVCRITGSVKDYVRIRSSNSTAQDRSQQQAQNGYLSSIVNGLERVLESLIGLQRRFYWESSSSLELMQSRISNVLGSIRDGIGNRYKSTRSRLSGILTSSSASNATLALNFTGPGKAFNQSSGSIIVGGGDQKLATVLGPANRR